MTELMQKFSTDANPTHPNLPPKDASTLILIDRSSGKPKILLGRRHKGHAFVPDRFVFPGGRVDPGDRQMSVSRPLDPRTQDKLMRHTKRPSAAKAQALALAAIRETFEETGLLLGEKRAEPPAAPAGPWAAFAEANVHPALADIHFIARAITPPRRPRRYDTRFFAVDASAIAHRIEGKVGPEAELVELVWLPLDETKSLDLMIITQLALQDLQARIEAGLDPGLPVPFYRVLHGKRVREWL
ncbi:MAG: NUDIX domain-containing protein [Alphaproteobacteria bacterium]|nr:NUDIX domain-containing protein [Alphaproteobacteria bacterium]